MPKGPDAIRLKNGRSSRDRAFASLSAILGDKPYLMVEPCGADATVFSFLAGAICPLFETPLREKAKAYPNLLDYCSRLGQQYFPSGA